MGLLLKIGLKVKSAELIFGERKQLREFARGREIRKSEMQGEMEKMEKERDGE